MKNAFLRRSQAQCTAPRPSPPDQSEDALFESMTEGDFRRTNAELRGCRRKWTLKEPAERS